MPPAITISPTPSIPPRHRTSTSCNRRKLQSRLTLRFSESQRLSPFGGPSQVASARTGLPNTDSVIWSLGFGISLVLGCWSLELSPVVTYATHPAVTAVLAGPAGPADTPAAAAAPAATPSRCLRPPDPTVDHSLPA